MLSVKYGTFQGLEDAFVADLLAVKKGQPLAPVAVVTPSRRLADRLQRLAAGERGLALLNVHFLTFHSLAERLVREAGGLGKEVWGDPLFYDQLMNGLLESPAGRRLLSGRPRQRGLAAAVRASLRDLADAGVEPARVQELLGEGLLEDPEDRERLEALLELLAAFDQKVAALPVAPPSALTRAAAEAAPDSAWLKSFRAVVYYGFYDLTGLQSEFFEAVARSRDVTVYYPFRKGEPAYAFAKTFFENRLHLGGVAPVAVPTPDPRPPTLDVISASGDQDQLWAVAKEILRLVEREGYAFLEIGVVARSLEPYRMLLRDAFAEQGVPIAASAGEPLLRFPLVKLALSLLSLKEREFPALAVQDLLGSPYLVLEAGQRERAEWRRLISRLRVHRGLLQWEGKLGAEPEAEGLLALVRAWAHALGPQARSKRGWGAKARHARAFVEGALALPANAEARESEAYAALLGALGELERFEALGGDPSWSEFVDAFGEKLRRGVLEADEPGGGVRVRDAMEARGESFRALFLIGMKEGEFPRLIREDAILRDRARAALRDAGGYWLHPKLAGYEEEKLLFHLLAASARERLIAVYPRSDEEGKAQIPSLYLRELRAAEETAVPRQPFRKFQALPWHVLNPKEASLRLAAEGADPSSCYRALGLDAEGFGECRAAAEALNAGGGPGAYDGLVGRPAVFEKRLLAGGLSASALESYARCPFQFFGSRVLGLAEPEDPEDQGDFSRRLKGVLGHRVLKQFYQSLGDADFAKGASGFPEPRLRAAWEEVLREFGWRQLGLYPVLWRVSTSVLAEQLERFLTEDLAELRAGGYRPAFLEQEVDGRLEVALPPGLEGLRFTGRTDRVDVAPGRFRVVDYKIRIRWDRKLAFLVRKGQVQQPPFYLELVGERLKDSKTEGIRFYSLEDDSESGGAPASHDLSAEEWTEVRGEALSAIGTFLAGIHEGAFLIYPSEERGYCGWCPMSSACRRSHPASLRRARRGPEFARFDAVKRPQKAVKVV